MTLDPQHRPLASPQRTGASGMTLVELALPTVARAWDAAGRPDPNWQGKAKATRARPAPRPGVCALTGVAGDVWDARHVVSDTFTAWDRLPARHADPAGLGFGPAAAWAFRCRDAMLRPYSHLDGACGPLDNPSSLFAALTALASSDDGWVSVPVSRQKHLVPWAAAGCVGTDDGWFPWGSAEMTRLGSYNGLRRLGFGEVALTEPAPRWPVLSRLPRTEQIWVLTEWSTLDGWRRHPSYMHVAARATRTAKDGQT